MPPAAKEPFLILLVEDHPADVRLMQEAFKDTPTPKRMAVVGDGEQAIAYLRQQGSYRDATRPDLILLDLNLPKRDGREVLAEIKADPRLRRIPVIILTTSHDEKDIAMAYDLHANAYIVKPTGLDQLIGIVAAIDAFWIAVAQRPPVED